MTTCLGKSCSFGLLSVSFANIYQFLCVSFFPFWFCGWEVIVLIPDHCLSIYFVTLESRKSQKLFPFVKIAEKHGGVSSYFY